LLDLSENEHSKFENVQREFVYVIGSWIFVSYTTSLQDFQDFLYYILCKTLGHKNDSENIYG